MFVERRRADTGPVFIRRPKARGVGSEHFVHQGQRAIGIETKFKLGVGDDDAARGSVLHCLVIQVQADAAHALGQIRADGVHHLIEADVLVVIAERSLGCGREQRLRQTLGLAQTRRQRNAAHSTAGLIVFPARADQIAAHHRLDQQRLELLCDHGAATHLLHFFRRHHTLGRNTGEVIGCERAETAKPEIGHLVEHLPLAGDRLGHHHVKR